MPDPPPRVTASASHGEESLQLSTNVTAVVPPDPAGKEDKRLLGFIPGRASFDVQSFRVSAGDLLSVLLINKEDPQEHNVAFLRSEDPEPFETAVRRWIAADPDSSRESG